MRERYIAITIWFNGFDERVAQVFEDANQNHPRYFESIDEIRKSVDPRFPGEVLCINLNTLDIEETL